MPRISLAIRRPPPASQHKDRTKLDILDLLGHQSRHRAVDEILAAPIGTHDRRQSSLCAGQGRTKTMVAYHVPVIALCGKGRANGVLRASDSLVGYVMIARGDSC